MDWIKPNCVFVEVTFTRTTASGTQSYTQYMPRHPSDFSKEELKSRGSVFSKEYMESIGQGHMYVEVEDMNSSKTQSGDSSKRDSLKSSPTHLGVDSSQHVTNASGSRLHDTLPMEPEDDLALPSSKGKQPEPGPLLAGASEDSNIDHTTLARPRLDNELSASPSIETITAQGFNSATLYSEGPGRVASLGSHHVPVAQHSNIGNFLSATSSVPGHQQMGQPSKYCAASNTGAPLQRAVPLHQGDFNMEMVNRRTVGHQTLARIQERDFLPMWAASSDSQLQSAGPSNAPVGPSAMAPVPDHLLVNPDEKMRMGFSPNYMGNVFLEKNKSADIPANQNCSLFILGLPPRVTHHQILSAIHGIGRVYQTHINPPEPEKGNLTAACKIIFFDRASAERFYDRYQPTGFRVPDETHYEGHVVWNRVRTAAQNHSDGLSRVLWISGPPQIVNGHNLTRYFGTKISFDVDMVIEHGGNLERAVVEYRFGSYRCQAETAKMSINTELTGAGVRVWFGEDPCAAAESGESVYQHPQNAHQQTQSLHQQGFYPPRA